MAALRIAGVCGAAILLFTVSSPATTYTSVLDCEADRLGLDQPDLSECVIESHLATEDLRFAIVSRSRSAEETFHLQRWLLISTGMMSAFLLMNVVFRFHR